MLTDDDYLGSDEILDFLADGDAPLTSGALYALSGMGTAAIARFREHWRTVDVARRRRVITALVESAEANFELDFNAVFRAALKDEDAQVRQLAIEGLWEDESLSLVSPLVAALCDDPDASVRAAAAASLGRFALLAELDELDERRANLVREALLAVLRNPQQPLEVRRRAVESIAYLSQPEVRSIITTAYADPNESMRLSAVFAMGRSVDSVWAPAVLQELVSESAAMRYEAARASGELELKAALPVLIKLLDDPDREVQLAAITSLGQIGGPSARKALERCAVVDDEVVCEAAEDAMRELLMGDGSMELFVADQEDDEEDDQVAEMDGED